MMEQYMRTGEGFLLVYAINSRNSLDELQSFYEQIQRVKDSENVPVLVVGNKCDLEGERRVSYEEGLAFGKSINSPFLETSPKQNINVDEAFYGLVRNINEKKYAPPPPVEVVVDPVVPQETSDVSSEKNSKSVPDTTTATASAASFPAKPSTPPNASTPATTQERPRRLLSSWSRRARPAAVLLYNKPAVICYS